MGPPPRPPVICYDLRTNSVARRKPNLRNQIPSTTHKRPKVTVVTPEELNLRVQQIKEVQDYQRPRTRTRPEKKYNPPTISTIPEYLTPDQSSSTSISSCSSLSSTDENISATVEYLGTPRCESKSIQTTLPTSFLDLTQDIPRCPLRNQQSSSIYSTPKEKKKEFSFYKGNTQELQETLDITDVDFFDKVEDETMIEVNELFKKMQSVLKDLEEVTSVI